MAGRELTAHHRVLFEQHPDAICELDRDGRIVSGNAALRDLTGRSLDELRDTSSAELVPPEDVGRVVAEFLAALAGEQRHFRTGLRRRNDDVLTIEVAALPITTGGEVAGVYVIARDVTAHEQARHALEESEHRFRGLFEGAGAGIAITTLDGHFVDANASYLDMLGYTLEELRDHDLLSITHPDERDLNERELAALLRGDVSAFRIEKRYAHKDGRSVWVRASISLIRDAAGQPMHIAATTEDITAAREAEERLHRSELLRRLAGQLALVGGWSVEAADRTVYWSEEIYRILDAPPGQEPAFEDAVALYPPADRKRLEAAIAACLAEGTPFDLELVVDTYAGRRLPVRAIGEAQRGVDGRIERVIGAFQDITELQAAGARAADVAHRLSVTFESMSEGVVLLDRDWHMTYVNREGERLLQRDRSELLGRGLWETFPEAVGTEVDIVYHRAVDTQTPQTIEDYCFEPLDLWLEINAYPSDEGLALYFRDVTGRRSAAEALRQHEADLRRQAQLLDEAQDAIIVRSLDHRVTYWNRSAERVYGWSAHEAVGSDIRDLLGDEARTFERADAAVRERGSWTGELQQRDRHGRSLTVDARWTLVNDDQGRPDVVLAINTDVTGRKSIEQQLLRAQRMESLGTLAGGVAHDLNNVLAPILLAAELLRDDLADSDSSGARLLETIHSSARRGADLVTQVLSFARGVEGRHTRTDIADLLRDIRDIIRDTFPKNIQLTLQLPDELGVVMGDSTQIQQVLLNLAVNARDAMPDGGHLRIAASGVVLDEQYAAATPGTTPGEYLLIEVEDDGTGMPPDVRDRVFEPFFTTKPQGSGTGLGLSTAAAIVRSHSGFLHAYSEPGSGSTFRLYLPEASESPDGQSAHDGDPDLRHGEGETILVVDDEAAVRSMTCQTLETHGYLTLEARDGAEAISVFAQHREHIDVVLTDMMMPIMDGPATIHALRRLDPEVRIVGASGLHGNGKVAKATSAGVRHFLPKPYTSRHLLEVLAEVLSPDGSHG